MKKTSLILTSVLVGVMMNSVDVVQAQQFLFEWGSFGRGDGQFDSIGDFAFDSSGNVYVPDYFNYRIQKFTSDGTFITKWGSEGIFGGQFQGQGPFDIAVDSLDNVYVLGGARNIQKYTSDGDFITNWDYDLTDDLTFNSADIIEIDSSDNFYITDINSNSIRKFDSSGNFLLKIGSDEQCLLFAGDCFDPDGDGPLEVGDGQFFIVIDVDVDSSGNVYVADTINQRIQKFSGDGTFLTKWGSEGTADGQFNNPTGVAVDSSGNVYVADTVNHRFQKFTSDGTFLTKWGSEGTGVGQVRFPRNIAIHPSGDVYVADNHRIQVFSFEPPAADAEPPQLTVPSDMRIETQSEFGSIVTFDVSASDNIGIVSAPTCDYPSQFMFEIGKTVVTCEAFDAVGNRGVATFTVSVILLPPPPTPSTPPSLDSDNDGILDNVDGCPLQAETFNGYQDSDGCPDTPPPLDSDNDGIVDTQDNCPDAYNPNQRDGDNDRIGDVCDSTPEVVDEPAERLFHFSITPSQSSTQIIAGKEARSVITIALESGSSQDVNLSCVETPSVDVTCDINPSVVRPPDVATLSVYTKDTTPPTQYAVPVIGVGGVSKAFAGFIVDVTPGGLSEGSIIAIAMGVVGVGATVGGIIINKKRHPK